jgi:hypothetical protein
MSKTGKIILTIIILTLIIIQFIPIEKTNPDTPPEQEIIVSDEVHNVFRESCYDCHSNETVWPFYSYVAPVSWFVIDDVKEGREHLNFSTWEKMSYKEQNNMKEDIWEEVSEGRMPLSSYVFLNPAAKLSENDFHILREWNNTDQIN